MAETKGRRMSVTFTGLCQTMRTVRAAQRRPLQPLDCPAGDSQPPALANRPPPSNHRAAGRLHKLEHTVAQLARRPDQGGVPEGCRGCTTEA